MVFDQVYSTRREFLCGESLKCNNEVIGHLRVRHATVTPMSTLACRLVLYGAQGSYPGKTVNAFSPPAGWRADLRSVKASQQGEHFQLLFQLHSLVP